MLRFTRRYWWVFLGSAALALPFGFQAALDDHGYAVLYAVFTRPDKLPERPAPRVSMPSPNDLQDVRSLVRTTHNVLNDLVGWGRIGWFLPQTDWSWQKVHLLITAGFLDRVRHVTKVVQPETIGQDLEAFAKAVEIAYQRRDARMLILAHRIIHDLDYWVFSPEGSKEYWGATITLEGERAPAKKILDGSER